MDSAYLMAFYIYHGAPGSAKTASLVYDVLIPAVKQGRHIIHNVRGFTLERCQQHMNNVPLFPGALSPIAEKWGIQRYKDYVHPDTIIDYIPTDDPNDELTIEELERNRKAFARFFHYSPQGALIVIDEIQEHYPSTLGTTDKAFEPFTIPESERTDKWRPYTLKLAFEKHRHAQWDIYASCQNISQVNKVIVAVSQGIYLHENFADRGFAFIRQTFYTPRQKPSQSTAVYKIKLSKFKKLAFKVYDSTVTGKAQNLQVLNSPFLHPTFLFIVVFVVGALYYAFTTSPILNSIFTTGNALSSDSQDSDSVQPLLQVNPSALENSLTSPQNAPPLQAQNNKISISNSSSNTNQNPKINSQSNHLHPNSSGSFTSSFTDYAGNDYAHPLDGYRFYRTEQIAYQDYPPVSENVLHSYLRTFFVEFHNVDYPQERGHLSAWDLMTLNYNIEIITPCFSNLFYKNLLVQRIACVKDDHYVSSSKSSFFSPN